MLLVINIVSSHFFLKLQQGKGFLLSTLSVPVSPQNAHHTLCSLPCICFLKHTFIIMAQYTPAISPTPHTCAQCAALNSQPPHPSDSLFTTASDVSSKFMTFKQRMPTNKKHLAVVEQENNKCPILHPGELNTEVFSQFETTCYNYIMNKDVLTTINQSRS